MDDVERDVLRLDFFERLNDGLDRTLGVGLDDRLKNLAGLRSECFKQVFEGDLRTPLVVLAADLFDPLLGERTRVLLVFHHVEFQTRLRHAVQSEYFYCHGRPGFLQPLVFLADQGADFAPELAGNHHVAHAQGAFANEHGGRGSAGFEAGFNDVAFGGTRGIGFQLQHFGLEHDHFQQLVDALFGERRDVHKNGVAAPLLTNEPFVLQLLADFHRVGVRVVGFVDGDDDRGLGCLRVAQGFQGLRHDAVVGSDHQNHDVGHVGAAGAHRAEGRMARRIEERDLLQLVFPFGMRNGNRVSADVLRDAAGFPGGDVGFADHIEQRRLAMVNVSHDGDHGRARTEVFRPVFHVPFDRPGRGMHDPRAAFPFLHLETEFIFGAQFLRGDFVNGLVDIGEDAQFHQVGDQLERLAF